MGISRAAHRNTHSLDCHAAANSRSHSTRAAVFKLLMRQRIPATVRVSPAAPALPIRQRTWNLAPTHPDYFCCLYGSEQANRARGESVIFCCLYGQRTSARSTARPSIVLSCLYGSEPGSWTRRSEIFLSCLYGSEPGSQTRSSLMISNAYTAANEDHRILHRVEALLPIRQRTSNFVTRPFSSISKLPIRREPQASSGLDIDDFLLPIRQRTTTPPAAPPATFLSSYGSELGRLGCRHISRCLPYSELRRPGARDQQQAAYTAANGWPAGTKALQHF